MERRIPSLDEFINESLDNTRTNEGLYGVTYQEMTLKDIIHLASKYVKNPKVIFGVPTKNTKLQLVVDNIKYDEKDISVPYEYSFIHKSSGGNIWAGRSVIVVYDNDGYVIYEANDYRIVIGANNLTGNVNSFIKSLKDVKELKSEDDYKSVLTQMTSWERK